MDSIHRVWKLGRAAVLAVVLTVGLGGTSANAAVIYLQNFEGGVLGPEFSGAGAIETTGGLSAFGFGSLHLRNAGFSSTFLTLSGLDAHTEVTLNFNLAMWDSIDLGGDRFVVVGGGTTLYDSSTDFGNYFPGDNISHGPGVHITDPFTGFNVPDYGVSTGFRDAGRSVAFTFAHTGSSLVIEWVFPSSQTGFDESFGIDNISVATNAVVVQPPPSTAPEPATLVLLGSGLVAMTAARRRRRLS